MGLALLLAATLAVAGFTKLRDPRGMAAVVAPVFGTGRAVPAVRALALVECALAAALVVPPTRPVAAVVTGVMMLAFIGALGLLRRREARAGGAKIACNCFGSSQSTGLRTGQVRNALLVVASALVVTDPASGVHGVPAIVLALCLASGLASAWVLAVALARLRGVAA